MVELDLLGVRVELPSNTPVLLLQERAGRHRKLSIFIGGPEAAAIAFSLDGVEPPRPLTHDLTCTLVESFGSRLLRVVLTELRDTTFYADLHLSRPGADDGTDALVVSARPSDAVALAVRTDAPIYATEELLEEAGFTDEAEDESPEEVVEEFREFIQNVSPEDFAS
ncbi:MAG: bifunctional nuclease family protein [Microthrixaceae bacterium]|nr:bifunctional nuclease family protein [Microthrixaceae bacterium]